MAREDMTSEELQGRVAYRNATRDRVGPLASAAGPSGTGIRTLNDLELFRETPSLTGENLPDVSDENLPDEPTPPKAKRKSRKKAASQ